MQNARICKGLGVFLFLSFLFISQARATDPAYVEELIQKAEQQRLYEDPAWRKILFMTRTRFGNYEGLFDDPMYYLSHPESLAAAKRDARGEMVAAIRKFASSDRVEIDKKSNLSQCVYPARFEYLQQHLQIDEKRFTIHDCPDLKKYLAFANYEGVSLVFSNFFADNPASMFGHTLLRLHRPEGHGEIGLLDDAANFAALIPNVNPLTYSVNGLFGFFIGRFALVPYSEKIQEYNNYESRDLWEYELNFQPQELRRLSLELWETGSFTMDYYYLNKNCAYVILALLEAAKPELDLTSGFHVYAIPSDTVKVVARYPGLVKQVDFKASARTRYLERAHALNRTEKSLFLDIINRFENSFSKPEFEQILQGCDQACQVRLLDAVIEYIDYHEKKVSTKKMEMYEDLRRNVLIGRSKIHSPSVAMEERPESLRPDLGPTSSMLEIGTGWTGSGGNISDLRWRPALHDISSSIAGYSDQLEIQVFDTILTHAQDLNKTYLQHFSILELQSLGQHELALAPVSWRIDALYDAYRNAQNYLQLFERKEISISIGESAFWGPAGAFAMLEMVGGLSSDPQLQNYVGAGPYLGFFWNFSAKTKWTSRFEWIHASGRAVNERHELVSRLSYAPSVDTEAGLEYHDQDGFKNGLATWRFYF